MRAVVAGAGVSGAFAADTLRRRFGPGLDLVVLEREDRVGGRAWRRRVSGVEVETGASLFHSSNRLLLQAADQLALHAVEVASGGSVGIWDGSRQLLRTSGHSRRDSLRLLARYRLGLVRISREVSAMVRRLGTVYPRLERGESWEAPERLWSDLGLWELSQRSAADHLHAGRFRAEFADGVSRNNYAQDSARLNALVDLVSLAGAGLGGGRLLRVAEGNAAVPAGLVERSAAALHTGAVVRRIERAGSEWSVRGDGFEPLTADVVVLACPLEVSGIELVGAPTPPPRDFVTVHVTFVAGTMRPGAVGPGPAPAFLLTTAAAGSLLSVERVADTPDGRALHKVFSTEELTDILVERYFVPTEVTRMRWAAYPRLPPVAAQGAFRLAPGLYSTSATEYAVSTMETQAIGGVATANLAARDRR